MAPRTGNASAALNAARAAIAAAAGAAGADGVIPKGAVVQEGGWFKVRRPAAQVGAPRAAARRLSSWRRRQPHPASSAQATCPGPCRWFTCTAKMMGRSGLWM